MGGGGKGGGGSSQPQTVGYEYFMAGIFGVCVKATNLIKIIYGERVAWSGNVSTNGSGVYVNNPGLYGGSAVGGSGGLRGQFYINDGNAHQVPNPVMYQYLGAHTPAFRGVTTLSMASTYVASFSAQFRQLYLGMQNLGFDWYSAKGLIAGTQVNPIHVIYQTLTDANLSGQYTAADIDDASFKAAADTLYNENFGLSPKWESSTKAQEFISSILKTIDGALVRNRTTGLFQIKLYRGGYNVDTLPVITADDFSELSSLGSISLDSTVNQLTVQYARLTDVGEETATITAQNTANIDLQGGVISSATEQYNHVTNAIPDLAGRILARDLRARSYPLKAYTLKGYSPKLLELDQGDLFVLEFSEEGYTRIVSRVLDADFGTLDDHMATFSCTEDIYGAPLSSVNTGSGSSQWEDPYDAPETPYAFTSQELPLALAVSLADFSLTDFAQYPHAGFVGSFAKKNGALDHYYVHNVWNGEKFTEAGQGVFGDYAILKEPVGKKDTVLQTYNLSGFALEVDDLLFVGDEIMAVESTTEESITVWRGVLDTLPQEHAQATRIWLGEADKGGFCSERFTEGATAQIALSTVNSLGTSTPTQADVVDTLMVARAYRPFPPAYLQVNGEYLPESIEGELRLDWYHRDRLEQLDVVIAQDEPDIGPEEGTTYTVKLYGEDGLLKKTVEGITENSYVWATEKEDCMIPVTEPVDPDVPEYRYNNSVKIELWAVRGGYESMQNWEHIVVRA